jgi:hypothetical protein
MTGRLLELWTAPETAAPMVRALWNWRCRAVGAHAPVTWHALIG